MDKLHDDLREVMGLIAGLRQVAISDDVYAYCRQAGKVERECYGFVEKHGPALLARQEGEDAERFAWWFGQRDESSVELIDMHIESINGKQPSLDDWRAAIDAARSGGGG